MTRRFYIERLLRQVYGAMPSDDSQLTVNLVNAYLNDAIGLAAKQCYKESIAIDGVAYVNNAFYTTFKNLAIVADSDFVWKIALPAMPIGLGTTDAISRVQLRDTKGKVSDPIVLLSANQVAYRKSLHQPQNKLTGWNEGRELYIEAVLPLSQYTGQVSMVSGGLSTDLDSELNVPDDYLPIVNDYLLKQLNTQRTEPQDNSNDGSDNKS
jgi:hypothetical protein